MKMKLMGNLVGWLQDAILAMQIEFNKSPVGDEFFDWIGTRHGKAAITNAAEVAWKSMKEDYEAWVEKQRERKSKRYKAFDTSIFFQNVPGLWVSDDFRVRVLAKANTNTQPVPLKSITLERDMINTEIEQALGANHLFTEAELCATVAKLIQEQWGGKAGKLLNNGYANLFYTSSYVVSVRWYADDREWSVGAWGRGDCRWGAGRRAFSPATTAA